MVTQWGFGEIPSVAVRSAKSSVLGRSVASLFHMSDETARIIDREAKARLNVTTIALVDPD